MARRQSTSTETSTRSGSNDVLCWCDKGVSHRDFVEFTLQNPEMEFGNLCEKIGVGQRCTSCLLNAEETYVKARQGEVQILAESDKIILKSAQSQVKKTAKHKFYDSLKNTVNWYLNNLDWCSKVCKKSKYNLKRIGL